VHFLERAARWYHDHGVSVERVLTDNAKAYHSRAWLEACQRLRDRTAFHPDLPAMHQRQGRTLHPDAPQRIGLQPQLPLQQPPRPRPPRLPPLVQPTQTAQLTRGPATDRPRLTPLWSHDS
jgi:hypothetical protein